MWLLLGGLAMLLLSADGGSKKSRSVDKRSLTPAELLKRYETEKEDLRTERAHIDEKLPAARISLIETKDAEVQWGSTLTTLLGCILSGFAAIGAAHFAIQFGYRGNSVGLVAYVVFLLGVVVFMLIDFFVADGKKQQLVASQEAHFNRLNDRFLYICKRQLEVRSKIADIHEQQRREEEARAQTEREHGAQARSALRHQIGELRRRFAWEKKNLADPEYRDLFARTYRDRILQEDGPRWMQAQEAFLENDERAALLRELAPELLTEFFEYQKDLYARAQRLAVESGKPKEKTYVPPAYYQTILEDLDLDGDGAND